MKKFLTIILCSVYIITSSGATINFHYCMGKFTGWDVAVAAPVKCNDCSMSKKQKQGCCNDKHATLQLNKDQLTSTISYISNSNIVYTLYHYSVQKQFSLFSKNHVAQLIHIPPLIQPVSAFILNCVFRI